MRGTFGNCNVPPRGFCQIWHHTIIRVKAHIILCTCVWYIKECQVPGTMYDVFKTKGEELKNEVSLGCIRKADFDWMCSFTPPPAELLYTSQNGLLSKYPNTWFLRWRATLRKRNLNIFGQLKGRSKRIFCLVVVLALYENKGTDVRKEQPIYVRKTADG